VIAELARLAFSDIRDFADWDGDGVRVKDSHVMGPKQSACIAEIVESPAKEGRRLRVKLHGKTRALEALGRHLGLFEKTPPKEGNTVFQVITRVPEPDWDGDDPDGAADRMAGETAWDEASGAPERVREDAP
jgi:phage terminase small subunit